MTERPIFFAPCPKLTKKTDFFPKNFTFLNKRFIWAQRMQFWQPGQFLEENQKVMFNLRRWQNRKKQKWYFLRKSSFPQNVSGEEDCSFQKPNKKISTKRTVVLAQNPKMQNVKKRNIKFFRSLFSTKSSDGQVETSTDYPAGKFRPKARNLWLSLLHWWKNSKFFQFFVSIKCACGHVKMKFWLPGQVFYDKGWIFFRSTVRKS